VALVIRRWPGRCLPGTAHVVIVVPTLRHAKSKIYDVQIYESGCDVTPENLGIAL
jgi:hypothetical protein